MKTRLLFMAAIAVSCTIAHADFVNGSFETGDFTGWTVMPATYGSFLGVTYYAYTPFQQVDGFYTSYFGAFDSMPDTISQDLTTTPGQNYTLSFFAGTDSVESGEGLMVTQNGLILFYSPIQNLTAPNSYKNLLAEFSIPVVGTGNDDFAFAVYDQTGVIAIDDVHLQAVPEPAPLASLALGAVGLAARRRKRSITKRLKPA